MEERVSIILYLLHTHIMIITTVGWRLQLTTFQCHSDDSFDVRNPMFKHTYSFVFYIGQQSAYQVDDSLSDIEKCKLYIKSSYPVQR
jgi:hypothetical protein